MQLYKKIAQIFFIKYSYEYCWSRKQLNMWLLLPQIPKILLSITSLSTINRTWKNYPIICLISISIFLIFTTIESHGDKIFEKEQKHQQYPFNAIYISPVVVIETVHQSKKRICGKYFSLVHFAHSGKRIFVEFYLH